MLYRNVLYTFGLTFALIFSMLIYTEKKNMGAKFLQDIYSTQFCRIKGCGSAPPPPPNIFERKPNQGKLYISLKGIYGRFRISLNNCEFTKFRDFAGWSQKSRSREIGQNFKIFLLIKYYEIRINQVSY